MDESLINLRLSPDHKTQSHEVLHARQDAKMLKATLSPDAKPVESLLTVLESRVEVQPLFSPAL